MLLLVGETNSVVSGHLQALVELLARLFQLKGMVRLFSSTKNGYPSEQRAAIDVP